MQSHHLLYRGLTGNRYLFSLFSTDFNAPCSTTIKKSVAWTFAVNGIVVQIEKPEWRDGARFMNVRHLSAYITEEEHLFIGQDNYLQITSIHQNLSTKQTATDSLILLQILTHRMSGYKKIDIGKLIQNSPKKVIALCQDLQNRFNCERYSCQLTKYFVLKKKRIYIKARLIRDLVRTCIKQTKQKEECQQLLSWLIDGDINNLYKKKELQINFRGITELFPQLENITFDFNSCSVRLSENKNQTWSNMVKYFKRNWRKNSNHTQNRSKLCQVTIKFDKRLERSPSNEFIGALKAELIDSKWKLEPSIQRKYNPSTRQYIKIVDELTFYKGGMVKSQKKPHKIHKRMKHGTHGMGKKQWTGYHHNHHQRNSNHNNTNNNHYNHHNNHKIKRKGSFIVNLKNRFSK